MGQRSGSSIFGRKKIKIVVYTQMQHIKKIALNATVISITICTIITMVNWVQKPSINLWDFIFSVPMLAGFLIGFFLYLGNTLSFSIIRKLIPGDPYYVRRMLLFIPFSILITIVVVFSINLIFIPLDNSISIVELLKQQRLGYYINFIIISIVCSVLLYAFNFYKVFKEGQLEKQILIAGAAKAQFESLKNQLDPHFLFNSLNVLTAIIEEDQTKAIDYTNSLSSIYRYILEQKEKKIVPIAQEVAFAQNYINLLKIRFEDAISCQIDLDGLPHDGYTIPLSLQLLLENCIQHNIATEEMKLHIFITTDKDYLIISNNLQEKKNKPHSTQVGLKNIIDRYEMLTQKNVEIIKNEHNFIVKLPILKSYA